MIFLTFLLVVVVGVFLITPTPNRGQYRWLRQHHAHRGFHDDLYPENSAGAFQQAVELGFGIECDVRLSKDHVPIMIHDPRLTRLAMRDEAVHDLMYEELKKIPILNTTQTFTDLSTLLHITQGQVPLMIEIKPNHQAAKSVSVVYDLLAHYEGNVSVISFDPRIVKMCKNKKMKHIPVGQLIEVHFKNRTLPFFQRVLLTMNAYQRWTQADFISVHRDLMPFFQWMTWLKVDVGVWTIRSPHLLKKCNNHNIAVLEKEALA